MKDARVTIFFMLGMLVTGWILPSVALANEVKDEGVPDGQSAEQPVVKAKKHKGFLAELFPSIGSRIWNPSISGNVKVNGNGHVGDELHLNDTLDLKMKDTKATHPDEVGLIPPDGKIRLNFEYYKLVGNKNLTSSANFKDTTYAAGEGLKSELRIKYLTAKWLPTYSPKGDKNSSLLFELVYFGQKQRVAGSLEGEQVKDFNGIIPAIGYRMEAGREGNTVYYAEASIYPGKQYYYNTEAGVVKLFGKLALGAGYRICAQKITSGNDYLAFKASGPFVQAIYKF